MWQGHGLAAPSWRALSCGSRLFVGSVGCANMVRTMSYRRCEVMSDNMRLTPVKYTPLKKAASNKYKITMQVNTAMADFI
jgi:hypothetical protein